MHMRTVHVCTIPGPPPLPLTRYSGYQRRASSQACTCMHVHKHTHTHRHVHVYVCAQVHTHIHVHCRYADIMHKYVTVSGKGPLRLRVTISGHGNSANSPVNNFGVDAYTTIYSAGTLVHKDSMLYTKNGRATTRARRDTRRHIFLDKNHQYYKR